MPLIGTALRDARLGRGLTVEQAAQDTRISARFLEALEEDRFDALPAPVYVRGFLRSYANYLRIDPQPLLDRLGASQRSRVSGPDEFVSGPRSARPSPRPAARDPWRARTPGAPVQVGADGAGDDDERWAPQPLHEPTDTPGSTPRATLDSYVENEREYDDGLPAEEPSFRPRRVAGVLVEREAQYNEAGGPMRFIALAGGGLIALVFFIVVGVLLAGSGGDDTVPAASGGTQSTPTPERGGGTVVAVGSPTARPSASPAASPSPAGSPSPEGTPAPSPTPEGPPPTATATLRVEAPAPFPTATPTPTETPSPTNTPVPPTPTPPPPTPTPFPAHPSGYQECIDNTCGSAPIRVVCVPGGDWFVDRPDVGVPKIFPAEQYGWKVKLVNNSGEAKSAGDTGCR